MTDITIQRSIEIPGTAILRASGELDAASIPALSNVTQELLALDARFIIAELSGVTLFTSSALGSFMGLRKRLIDKGGELVLASLGLDIMTKLNLMGANKIFKMYADVRTAQNAYQWQFTGKAETVHVSFPSQLTFVPPVRQLVSRIAQSKGYSNRDSFRIETIVDEVCNNAVEHGAQESGVNIKLNVAIDREKIDLEVVNVSNHDNVSNLRELIKAQPSAAGSVTDFKRGRGIALIKMLSNQLNVDITDTGTSVHVTRLRGE